ncbi:hypothetical protein D3C76_1029010 [compost metagenome]
MNTKQDNEDIGYLFNVDILIKNESNPLAIQLLIELLNQSEHVVDYRIKSGMKLGGIIETLMEMNKKTSNEQKNVTQPISKNNKTSKVEKASAQPKEVKSHIHQPTNPDDDPRNWIRSCIKDNRLVRMTANRLGQHFNIPCRILNFDEEKQFINVYHVDEKQVYSFNLNEIDSFNS